MTQIYDEVSDEALHRVSIPLLLIAMVAALVLGVILGAAMTLGAYSLSIIWKNTLGEIALREVTSSISMTTVSLFLGAVAWWYLRRAHTTLRSRWRWPEGWTWYCTALSLAFFTATIWSIMNRMFHPERIWQVMEVEQIPWWAVLVYAMIVRVLLVPFAEETLFRGVLLPALERWSNPWISVIGSATVFCAFHIYVYRSVDDFLAVFAVGVGAALLHARYRTLIVPFLYHAALNLFTAVFALLAGCH